MKKPKVKKNKYQIGMRLIVIFALLFIIAFSFAVELYFNGVR